MLSAFVTCSIPKILVIEDAIDVREIVIDILEAEEFEVVGAHNGRVGVDLAKIHHPDLILCDVMMPELDGYGVLSALRQEPELAAVPFVFLTAKATKADRREGMNLGADDFLTKPFTRNELLDAIATRLEKRAVITQEAEQQIDELRHNIALALPHELRTPLNGIIATAQVLQDMWEDFSAEEIEQLLGDIGTSGHRLYRLIQNFLLYADLELTARDEQKCRALAELSINRPDTTIAAAIDAHIQQSKLEARRGDLAVILEGGTVRISDSALSKITAELLDNACKFSTEGQPIQVRGEHRGRCYVLSVCDGGRGMTPAQIARVGAYQQFDRRAHEQQGSGLGLSIVQKMMQLYGGELQIESQPDRQTCAIVTLLAR